MSETLYDHKWMDLKEDHNGEAFVSMGHDAVLLVPMTHRYEILFIEEKSIAYQVPVLTLPTGSVENNELPHITANRELQEEVGFRAEDLTYIGTIHPSIKYMHWRCRVYLAQKLFHSDLDGDETSPVRVRAVHVTQINRLITSRKLSDAMSIAGLYLAYQHLQGKR